MKNKIDFDYTQGKKPFRDVFWINIKTGEKELIRLPIANRMRDTPLTPYHVSEVVYRSWIRRDTCNIFKGKYENGDYGLDED